MIMCVFFCSVVLLVDVDAAVAFFVSCLVWVGAV